MNAKLQHGQVVRLIESIVPDEGPWRIEKGTIGTVIGWDDILVRARFDNPPTTMCIRPCLLESMSLGLSNAA